MTGSQLIAKERQRQIEEEGFTPEHDDNNALGQLGAAAVCYAYQATSHGNYRDAYRNSRTPLAWPCDKKWWKPSQGDTPADRIRDLTKAGALIAAEIDRLQRLEAETDKLLYVHAGTRQQALDFAKSKGIPNQRVFYIANEESLKGINGKGKRIDCVGSYTDHCRHMKIMEMASERGFGFRSQVIGNELPDSKG